jgi:hypothetical protein
LIIGVLLVACRSVMADNPPTWVGGGFPQEKPAATTSYIRTSDNKLLLDGAENLISVDGDTNYPGKLSTFPGPVVDILMQQCFGGGFAKGMQTWLNQYTFTAATNWNELALNKLFAPPRGVDNFTRSWVQTLPRREGFYQRYVDAIEGATASPPNPMVDADPFGPMGIWRSEVEGEFENPSFASADARRFPPDPNSANNGRDLAYNNQWAILIATQPDHPRFSANIKRVYDGLRGLSTPIPSNHIIVLYGDSAANTTTPDGTPINGPISRENFFKSASGGNAKGNLFGSIKGLGDMGIPDQTPATPDATAHLFVYNTGHGNSFTLNGAQRAVTDGTNRFAIRVDALPTNGFIDIDGDAPPDGDTTSFVDLQISSRTPLNAGVGVTINGTGVGLLNDDNTSSAIDLTYFLGSTYEYNVSVPTSFLNSISTEAPIDITLENVASVYDGLIAAVTFNSYGDAWTVSLVPEPATIVLFISTLAMGYVFSPRNRMSKRRLVPQPPPTRNCSAHQPVLYKS